MSRKICNSQYMLEIDHRFPFSLGGAHTPENLRLLCRVHNQYRAEMLFNP
ncbi:MAG: HNH endonuclease, partial [Bdellovibrionales bacterium]|nr:HNH endonuclease [Bdellovibrionales bacterium]